MTTQRTGEQRIGGPQVGLTGDEALEMAQALPGVVTRPSGDYTAVRVSGKGFGYLLPDGSRLMVKATLDEQAAWVAEDPDTYSATHTSGRFGWIMVRLDRARPDELSELITEGWRLTAPVRLFRSVR